MSTDDRNERGVHEAFAGLIARTADESIAEPDRARLAAHLSTCASCRTALDEQREARHALLAWTPAPAASGFVARVLGGLETQPSWLDAWDFRQWTWRAVPVAAGLALAAIFVVARVDVPSTTTASATVEVVSASVALATDDLSGADAVALLLVADPDEAVSAAFEELGR